jgi:hypothetical protein
MVSAIESPQGLKRAEIPAIVDAAITTRVSEVVSL